MKVMVFNGSPRKKNWNTVTLLEKALEGAVSAGAQAELVQLYDLNYSGCISCFSCKKIDRKQDGVCAIKDDLTAVLDRVREADALIIGTPIYYGTESARTRALLERLLFPYLRYSKDMRAIFPRRINTAMIYTMNIGEELIEPMGLDKHFSKMQMILAMEFGACEVLTVTNTQQFDDYDKYEADLFDKEVKYKRHQEVFPEDCQRAFELGLRMASGVVPEQ